MGFVSKGGANLLLAIKSYKAWNKLVCYFVKKKKECVNKGLIWRGEEIFGHRSLCKILWDTQGASGIEKILRSLLSLLVQKANPWEGAFPGLRNMETCT